VGNALWAQVQAKDAIFFLWPALLVCLVTSCVSTGSSNLSLRNAEKIIRGETTKGKISEVPGKPEQILKLDKEGLKIYLSRVAIGDSPQLDLGEDLYEVWIYNRWNQAVVLVLTPSYE
jgi:hypothetical protein